jgi:hypothetical protein
MSAPSGPHHERHTRLDASLRPDRQLPENKGRFAVIGVQPGKPTRKVEAAIAGGSRALAAANVSYAMSRMTAGAPAAPWPIHRSGVDAGPALTVGVDGGDLANSLIGELMSLRAQIRRIAGMVIEPGDLIVDGDGTVSVPTTMERQSEIKQLAKIRQDQSDHAWVDAALTRLGCRINARAPRP